MRWSCCTSSSRRSHSFSSSSVCAPSPGGGGSVRSVPAPGRGVSARYRAAHNKAHNNVISPISVISPVSGARHLSTPLGRVLESGQGGSPASARDRQRARRRRALAEGRQLVERHVPLWRRRGAVSAAGALRHAPGRGTFRAAGCVGGGGRLEDVEAAVVDHRGRAVHHHLAVGDLVFPLPRPVPAARRLDQVLVLVRPAVRPASRQRAQRAAVRFGPRYGSGRRRPAPGRERDARDPHRVRGRRRPELDAILRDPRPELLAAARGGAAAVRRAPPRRVAAPGGGRARVRPVQEAMSPPPPLPRTNRTSLVPPLVLSGHGARSGRMREGGEEA